ncbi:MAG: type II toxin-antitoxin system RatA family toxin [Acidimicrobiia bacterium]
MEYTLHATTVVPAPPGAVFDLVTDVERLPDWNLEIPKVVESPAVLEVGSEWVVQIHAMKTRWNSRARVVDIDRDQGVFAYRSQSDDGNPSYADWRWRLTPALSGHGTQVDVEVDIRPRTFLRRWVASRLRRSGLRKAIEQSLASLHDQLSVR